MSRPVSGARDACKEEFETSALWTQDPLSTVRRLAVVIALLTSSVAAAACGRESPTSGENLFSGYYEGSVSIVVTTAGGSFIEQAAVTLALPVRDSIVLKWSGVTDSVGRVRFTNVYAFPFPAWAPVEISVTPPAELGLTLFAPVVFIDSMPHARFPQRPLGHTVTVIVEPLTT